VEDCAVQFNVEAVNRFEQYIMNTAAEAVEYVERVGSDHCGVLLDAFHLNIEEDSIHDAIVATGDKLGHLHIGETNRRAPGRGRMPWDEIFGAVREANYEGAITMEPFLTTMRAPSRWNRS
jgi:D-psicose/D-tagatose/L-ribulose 3-epimerase